MSYNRPPNWTAQNLYKYTKREGTGCGSRSRKWGGNFNGERYVGCFPIDMPHSQACVNLRPQERKWTFDYNENNWDCTQKQNKPPNKYQKFLIQFKNEENYRRDTFGMSGAELGRYHGQAYHNYKIATNQIPKGTPYLPRSQKPKGEGRFQYGAKGFVGRAPNWFAYQQTPMQMG